jgi:AraC-like DNA-binding protein
MLQDIQESPLPVVRAGNLLLIAEKLQAIGVPVSRYFDQAEIPSEVTERPEVLISLPKAIRFLGLTSKTESIPNLGLLTGQATLIGEFGAYGELLNRTVTVYDYLRIGIPFYSALSNAESFWLEDLGHSARLHHEFTLEPGMGTTQSDLNTVAIVIGKFREALGPEWNPQAISLAWECDDLLPNLTELRDIDVVTGTGQTYIELSRSDLRATFPVGNGGIRNLALSSDDELGPIPNKLIDLIGVQMERLIANRQISLPLLAETLGMHARTLQNHLTQSGMSYRRLLSEARFRLATDWLATTGKPIAEIANDLGYRDASNFTRAFRKMSGLSPRAYRRANHA